VTFAERLRASRFLRFGIVGAAGFVVDETVLKLVLFALNPYAARAVSIFCAMTFTWWGNRTLTFAEHAAKGSSGAILREWFKFILANALGAIVNYGTYSLLVALAPAPFNNPMLATAIGVAIGLVFNFTLSKRFVFKAG
jgi:putative flippase GtrA